MIIMLLFKNTIYSRQVEVKLTGVFRFEVTGFKLNNHKASQIQIIKQQVDIEIVAANIQMLLIPDKRETGSKFHQKLCYITYQCLLYIAFILAEWNEVKYIRISHSLNC